jgi:lysophospholipase L1-like esterase
MGRCAKLTLIALILSSMTAFAQVDETTDSVALEMEADTSAVWVLPELFSAYDSTFAFIRFNDDTLCWGKDSMPLVRFYEKLDRVIRTRKGNVHIMHIGGSHVQAGTMSHRIRKHVLAEYGGAPADRGLLFPYSAANACNNPRDYCITRSDVFSLIRNVYKEYPSPLGMSGISVYCTQSTYSIKFRMNEPDYDFATDTLVLFGRSNGMYIDPVLKYDTIWRFPDEYDSLNERYYFYPGQPLQEFTFYFPCGAADTFFVNGVWLKNGKPGVTFTSIGVNGAAVPSYLRCKNFTRDMKAFPPDLVIFGIGVNDAYGNDFDSTAFKNNYLQLIARIREANPDCAFIFLSNNDTWKKARKGRYYVNQTGPDVSDVMHRLANLTGGAVWDQFEVMGGLGSMAKWQAKGLAQKDRVHFTVNGYNLIGDLFWHAFVQPLKSMQE